MKERNELIEHIISNTIKVIYSLKYTSNSEWLDVDLTILQLKALFLLYAVEGMPMKRLAERLGISVTAVTGLVDRLVESGFVQREEDPEDRRLVIARPTDIGREKLERLQEVRRDRLNRILDNLTTDELLTVSEAIDILHNAILKEVQQENNQT